MQDEKSCCIMLQSDRQGDIPTPVEKMGTLTHLQKITVLQFQCTVPVSLQNFLKQLLKPDVNICIPQILYKLVLCQLDQ